MIKRSLLGEPHEKYFYTSRFVFNINDYIRSGFTVKNLLGDIGSNLPEMDVGVIKVGVDCEARRMPAHL